MFLYKHYLGAFNLLEPSRDCKAYCACAYDSMGEVGTSCGCGGKATALVAKYCDGAAGQHYLEFIAMNGIGNMRSKRQIIYDLKVVIERYRCWKVTRVRIFETDSIASQDRRFGVSPKPALGRLHQ